MRVQVKLLFPTACPESYFRSNPNSHPTHASAGHGEQRENLGGITQIVSSVAGSRIRTRREPTTLSRSRRKFCVTVIRGLIEHRIRIGSSSSSTVGGASWPQPVDSTQGDAFQREILVSRQILEISVFLLLLAL
jgi:hypothetical protein